MQEIKEISSKDFHEEIKSDSIVIIDFFAEWCGACMTMMPMLEEIAYKNDKVKILKVNIESSKELAQNFEISSLPSLILFKDGIEKDRLFGYIDQEILEQRIRSLSE